MKKFLVLLMILAVAGGVFAQGLVLTGDLETGIAIRMNDGEDAAGDANKATIGMLGNAGDFATRFNLNGAWKNEAGDVGLNFGIRSNLLGSATGGDNFRSLQGAYLETGYVWFKVLDGMIQLNAGKGGPGGFGTGGGVDESFDICAGLGISALIKPMAGLDIGVGIRTHATSNGAVDGVVNDLFAKEVGEALYGFGFKYAVPNLLTVVANLQMDSLRNVDSEVASVINAAFGVNVVALKDAGFSKIAVDARLGNLGQTANAAEQKIMNIRIGERVDYASGDLGAGIRFQQTLLVGGDGAGADADDYAPAMVFTGWLQYAIGTITPRIDFGYGLNTSVRNFYREAGWDVFGDSRHDKNKEKWAGFTIAPSVKFAFGSSFIKLGYGLSMNLTTGDDKPADGVAKTFHQIYLDYKVSF